MSQFESDDDPELAVALALSMQVDTVSGAEEPGDGSTNEDFSEVVEAAFKSKQKYDVVNFHGIMWDSTVTTDSDKERWVSQGIHTGDYESPPETASEQKDNKMAEAREDQKSYENMLEQLADTHRQWGLVQSHGGPCGVLAVVQAELLRILLWGKRETKENNVVSIDYPSLPDSSRHRTSTALPQISPDLVENTLAGAIAIVLARVTLKESVIDNLESAGMGKARLVLPFDESGAPLDRNLTWDDLGKSLFVHTIGLPEMITGVKRQKRTESDDFEKRSVRLARAIAAFLLTPAAPSSRRPLDSFQRQGGVILLTMSVVESRGYGRIQNEFDDSTSHRLTSQFGHCGQELMNMMLTGQAVSNVFDHTMNLGEMVCKGISSQATVGYLTQLEAMRYCEVGNYYKSPKYPVWVVGSTSHFTVIFGDDDALKESNSDKLLATCQRAFKMVEGGEENGFIRTDQLGQVLATLDLDVGGDSQVQTLAAALEVSGAGIILWDSFWKTASRLLTGATLESVLQGNTIDLTGLGDDGMPQVHGENLVGTEVEAPSGDIISLPHVETDEEMARRLAREWDDGGASGIDALAQAARASSPATGNVADTTMSDEELARKLQQEFNAEGGDGSSVAATDGSPPALLPGGSLATNPQDDAKLPAHPGVSSEVSSLDFERFGDSFPLKHYNGLRGGTLTQLRVTRLSAVEAVGASIALNNGGQSGSGDLEDVVRTKYPSCAVNWLGKPPPFID